MAHRFTFIFACTFITTALNGMDTQKEPEEKTKEAINMVRTCDLETIRKKISREQLIQHTHAFSHAAMPCENTLEIFDEFTKIINPQPSVTSQTFAHYVNKHSGTPVRSFTGNPFLDTLILNGKLKKTKESVL